jgi:MFS family permease
MLMSGLAYLRPITPDDWRWVMLVAATPAVLGIFVLGFLPESPAWLSRRNSSSVAQSSKSVRAEVFRPPLLKVTLLGILLGAVPLMGNWGAINWMVPWAKTLQESAGNDGLSALTQWSKSSGAAIGSLFGGWLASLFGRRATYFVVSLLSLASSYYVFHYLTPLDSSFLPWVFVNGLVGTIYFGWLPLYLPELFPTHVRATGTGITFNWGRILTAVGVLMGGQLVKAFDGDYAQVGQRTCLVYALGMLVICFAPDTSQKKLDE